MTGDDRQNYILGLAFGKNKIEMQKINTCIDKKSTRHKVEHKTSH